MLHWIYLSDLYGMHFCRCDYRDNFMEVVTESKLQGNLEDKTARVCFLEKYWY